MSAVAHGSRSWLCQKMMSNGYAMKNEQ